MSVRKEEVSSDLLDIVETRLLARIIKNAQKSNPDSVSELRSY